MEINQDALIEKLVKEKSLKQSILANELEQGIEVNCVSLSEDNLYLICGCTNGVGLVAHSKSKLQGRIILPNQNQISAVFIHQEINRGESKYTIFVGILLNYLGDTQGNDYEYSIVEFDEKFKIEGPQVPRLQQRATLPSKIQSIYHKEHVTYTVSSNQINANQMHISNFPFEINASLFIRDCLYLWLTTNKIVRVPLRELRENVSIQDVQQIIYEAQSPFYNFSVDSQEIVIAVVFANQKTVQFQKRENPKDQIKYDSTKNILQVQLIDSEFFFVQFDDFSYKVVKYDFTSKKVETINLEYQVQPLLIIVGALLLKNMISYPTILMIDSRSGVSVFQIGTKANYQLPFIFWVWMRTIKDLELDSLMSENHSNQIMEELKGKERGQLVQSYQLFFQQQTFTRSQFYILNNIGIASQVKILILYRIQEGQFRFFEQLIRSLNKMSEIKYFDLSYSKFTYNQQNLKDFIEVFKQKNIILDYLGLSGLGIGKLYQVNENDPLDESIFETHQLMKSIDHIAVNVSLRDNGFNDGQGQILLQKTKEIRNLKMLDISGNTFENQTLSVLLILMQLNNAFFYRFDEDFSLKMLCISFTDALQETAMKAATDYLIRKRMNNNLYIYITRKKDALWDSSISEYMTKDLRKQKVTCMSETFTIFVECIKTTFWVIKRKGLYCMEQMLCTTFFLKKYVACGYCTFLTTPIGKYCLVLFGSEHSYYEFNDEQQRLEDFLEERHKLYFGLIFIVFALYYSFIIAFSVTYDNSCAQSTWTGHLVYLIFVVISTMVELGIGIEINGFRVAHQYYRGEGWKRNCQIGKDLLISQLTKFTLFTCICFIVLTSSCGKSSGAYTAAIIIISINQFVEFLMVVKNVLFPYRFRRGDITQMQVLTFLSMFLSMTMIRKQLQKWPEGENNYKFFGSERNSFKVPRQVFQIIVTLVLQDFPMLIIQLAHGAKNPDNSTNKILLCSLLVIIIHCFYLVMKLLTVTRAGLINEEVTLEEYQNQFQIKEQENIQSPLKRFVKYFLQKVSSLFASYDKRSYNILQSVEIDYFNYNAPRTAQNRNLNQVQAEDQISQKRILLYQEDKKINFYQKVAQQQHFLSQYSKQYGKEIAAWKPSNDMPYCIVDTLLIDVPRTFFTSNNLEWVQQYDSIRKYKISSLHQEIEGFDFAYEFFKDKEELDILDLGYGSGYVSLVLLALALRRNPKMKIRLYLVDHVEETEVDFTQLLQDKFQNFKDKAEFFFSNQDCLKGFTMFEHTKFDFIHMGFGATKWRIEKQIIPRLKPNGKLFGYKIVTSALQKQFTWDNDFRQFKYNLNNNLENYGIMEPLIIQKYAASNRFNTSHDFIYPKELAELKFTPTIERECALCYGVIEPRQPRFINPYWGECICRDCGNAGAQLNNQGFEKDIGKLKYKSDVIYYSGEGCKLEEIKSLKYLFENRVFPLGVEKNRKYRSECCVCIQNNKNQIGWSRGFKYYCLVCEKQYCNQCGLDFMNELANNSDLIECFVNHPIQRIMFPATLQDNMAADKQGTESKANQSQRQGSTMGFQSVYESQIILGQVYQQ